ncbi:MAG: hypothetical protein J2O48_07120 [Solirubrobacterales bacterium]|nr:hypothetical protein [Solirubrobacterales bacterium]
MATPTATDWLELCRTSAKEIRTLLASSGTIADRAVETGTRGEGGDRTLVIDERAEDIIFRQLDALAARGFSFDAVSEERGIVRFGAGGSLRVVIDPIDGSLNAKRGLPHHALSVAVADGNTMADVSFGYVYDFGPGEEWWAASGQGAWVNGAQLDAGLTERRGGDGRLEVLGIESADPRWVAHSLQGLTEVAYRLRAMGTIAASLCQVAAGRLDGLVSLRACRAVDAAAGQLIVREGGGVVTFCGLGMAAPLDLVAHSSVVAARTKATLSKLEPLGVSPDGAR